MTITQRSLLQGVKCKRHVDGKYVNYTFSFPFNTVREYCIFREQWKHAYELQTQLVRGIRYGVLKVAEPALSYKLSSDMRRFVPLFLISRGKDWAIYDHLRGQYVPPPSEIEEAVGKWINVGNCFAANVPTFDTLTLKEWAHLLIQMRWASKMLARIWWYEERGRKPILSDLA